MFPPGIPPAALAAIVSLLLGAPVMAAESTPAANKKPKLVDLWQPGDRGQRMNIRGQVTSIDGTPLPGINIFIRQKDGHGDYVAQYQTTLTTDDKGHYQFGSIVPNDLLGANHVHVTVDEAGWQYFSMSILFEGDPNLEDHYEEGKPVFLEESTVKGVTIMFGRFDIVLMPE